ncbi:MAG TPA: response regulator [Phenylobacterium sp.]|nr:response regulator [Phenylobacterium sp.]
MSPPDDLGTFFYVLQEDLKVLYVDDDPILREFAVVHLSSEHAQVRTAEDGLDALQQLEVETPELVLLDLEMPRMDGFETLQRLRADPRFVHLPVIVVTSREDAAAIDRAYELGATFFTVKPINWRLLSYEVRYVHRAHMAELSLREAAARAQAAARENAERLTAMAYESRNFLSLALESAPSLRPAAASYAAALEGAVHGLARS